MVAARKTHFGMPVGQLFPHPENFKGEIGLEIEVEGKNLPKAIKSYWKVERDGSLRGESAEYILKAPIKRTQVKPFVKYLAKQFVAAKAHLDFSMRTSVHVHVNVADMNMVQCYTFVMLYLLFEDLMASFAGPSRVGNLFCLRARDAEFFVDCLTKMAKTRVFNPEPEMLRYASVNVCAIQKFGSVEFRALRGTIDHEIIGTWVYLLTSILDASLNYKSPLEVVGDLSRLGPEKMLQNVFGENWQLLTQDPGWENLVWDAARLVQEVAYATKWDAPIGRLGRMFPIDNVNEDVDIRE